jgi:hypothetical protein
MLLALLTLLTGVSSLQTIPPEGEIMGRYYVTNSKRVTTTRESETINLAFDKDLLLENLDTLIGIEKTGEILFQNFEKELKIYKKQAKEFIPTTSGKLLTVLGADTATQSTINCTNMGGHIFDIKTPEDIATIKSLSTAIVTEIKETVPTQADFTEFWLELVLTQEKLPIFPRTGSTLPPKLDDKATKIVLSDLNDPSNCAFFNSQEKSYKTAKCDDSETLKNVVCELNTGFKTKRFTFLEAHRQNNVLNSLRKSFSALFENRKRQETEIKPKSETIVSVFNKNETTMIKNLRTITSQGISYNSFQALINYSRNYLKTLTALYKAFKEKNLIHIIHILMSKTQDAVSVNNVNKLHSQIVDTDMYTTTTQIRIKVKAGTRNKQMISATLYPLIFNNQQPQFSGHTLRSTTECLYNDCTQDPCYIKTVTQIPCCNVNLLNLEGSCPNIPSNKLNYLSKMENNKYLLVSSHNTLISSHTCPNIYVEVSGTILISIDVQASGCDIQVGNISLPIVGAVSAEEFISPTKRNSINLMHRFQPDFSHPQNTYNQYLLPISLMVGTVATLTGTGLTLYLFFKKRLSLTLNTRQGRNTRSPSLPESFPLRPILRPSISVPMTNSGDSDSLSSN